MRLIKPALTTVTALALVATFGLGASPALAADTTTTAINVAEAKVGADVQVTKTSISAAGVTVSPAMVDGEAATTLVATKGATTSVIAVLDEGDSAASFGLDLPPGSRLEHAPDGALLVTDTDATGTSISAVIEKPWAVDAAGKSLPTSYRVKGTTLVQEVDTAGAKFPVVADPSITGWGAYLTIAVAYVQWTKAETRNLANSAAVGAAAAAASACGSIPHALAKAACVGIVAYKLTDFSDNVAAAKAEGKCLKARVPVAGLPLGTAIGALDFYRKTC